MSKLGGRKILVTGAASGMGRKTAELFADNGAKLALFDRDQEGLERLGRELGMFHQVCDVADRAQVLAGVAQAGIALDGLDGIVNGAGILKMSGIDDIDPDSWDRMIAVNLTGPFNVVTAALPLLRRAEFATIVNFASVSALMPMPGTAGYSASKAGLVMLTRSLAMDLAPRIRVNSICPGTVRTEMTRYIWENPEHTQRAIDRAALKRLGEAEDVARAALFLTSEDSAFTTGAALTVDGGFSWH